MQKKVASVYGQRYNEVTEINKVFSEMADALDEHMKKEKAILFPHIKKMVLAQSSNKKVEKATFGSVNNPVEMFEQEHKVVGDALNKIAELSNNYTVPEDACNTFKVLYAKLEDFEHTLHQHIHLENNILFPKAIELEKKV